MGSKLFRSKKGIGLMIYIGIFFLLSAILVITAMPIKDDGQILGQKQYDILEANEKVENVKYYMDVALQYAVDEASADFKEVGVNKITTRCGTRVAPNFIVKNKKTDCSVDYMGEFERIIRQKYNRYLERYSEYGIYNNNYGLELKNVDDGVEVTTYSKNDDTIEIPIKAETNTQVSSVEYMSGPLGSCGYEKTVKCGSGNCLAGVALSYYKLYVEYGKGLPYIWGGESPYEYRDSMNDGKCSSFFDDGTVTNKQPGRETLTTPGFDCSGWIWWIGKHSEVEMLKYRKNANNYYLEAKKGNAILICDNDGDNKCSKDSFAKMEPGDIIFYKKPSQDTIKHIIIYMGNGMILHSRGGPDGNNGLKYELYEEQYSSYVNVHAVYRMKFLSNGEEVFGDYKFDDTDEGIEIETPKNTICGIAPNDVNKDDIRKGQTGSSFDFVNVEKKLKSIPGLMDEINEAHLRFSNVPVQFIIGIITAESIGINFMDIANEKACSGSFCGLMQTGLNACDDVIRNNLYQCNFLSLEKGGDNSRREGIMIGTAYLSLLLKQKEFNPNGPDYLLTAMAYNAGWGNFGKIMEQAKIRIEKETGKNIELENIRWSQIRREDIENTEFGKKYPGKGEEVMGYPNLVGKSMLEQGCGNSNMEFSNYVNPSSYLSFESKFSTIGDVDFSEFSLIEELVKKIKSECKNDNLVCLQKIRDEFIDLYPDVNIRIISDYNSIVNLSARVVDDINYGTDEDGTDEDLQYVMNHQENNYNDIDGTITGKDAYLIFADQLNDCYENGQEKCACRLNFWNSKDSDSFKLLLDTEENVYFDYYTDFNNVKDKKDSLELDFAPFEYISYDERYDVESLELTQFEYDDQTYNGIKFNRKNDDFYWIPRNGELSLYKNDKKNMSFYFYDEENEREVDLCINNKKNYLLDITIDEINIVMNVFLDDKVPPFEITNKYMKVAGCIDNMNTVIFDWAIPFDHEPVSEFILYIKDDKNNLYEKKINLTNMKIVDNPNEINERNRLFKIKNNDDNQNWNYFYYMMSEIEDFEFTKDRVFTFAVLPVDNYGNRIDQPLEFSNEGYDEFDIGKMKNEITDFLGTEFFGFDLFETNELVDLEEILCSDDVVNNFVDVGGRCCSDFQDTNNVFSQSNLISGDDVEIY